MLFPPETASSLLGSWLGAGTSLRSATMRFHQPAAKAIESELFRLEVDYDTDDDDHGALADLYDMLARSMAPVPGAQLAAWLDERPHTHATVYNFSTLVCAHPRCRLL